MPAIVLARDVPGYAESAASEEEIRAVAFLGLPERIAGLDISPLTLRRVQWLTMVRSPFLSRMDAKTLLEKPGIAADILLFLWIVAPTFQAGNDRQKKRFFKRCAPVLKLPAEKVIQEILEYIEESFMDSGESSLAGDQKSYYSTAASIVGFFHRSYGLPLDVWDDSRLRRFWRKLTGQVNVLDLPLKLAFQFMRVQQRSQNGELKFTNRLSDKKINEWQAALNAPHKRN